MARYIDADILIEEMKKESNLMFNNYLNGFIKAIKMVNDSPTADVQLINKGYWRQKYKEVKTTPMSVMDDGIIYIPNGYECSVCSNEKGKSKNLCLYCGARMEE